MWPRRTRPRHSRPRSLRRRASRWHEGAGRCRAPRQVTGGSRTTAIGDMAGFIRPTAWMCRASPRVPAIAAAACRSTIGPRRTGPPLPGARRLGDNGRLPRRQAWREGRRSWRTTPSVVTPEPSCLPCSASRRCCGPQGRAFTPNRAELAPPAPRRRGRGISPSRRPRPASSRRPARRRRHVRRRRARRRQVDPPLRLCGGRRRRKHPGPRLARPRPRSP